MTTEAWAGLYYEGPNPRVRTETKKLVKFRRRLHLILTNRAGLGHWASTQSPVHFVSEQQEVGKEQGVRAGAVETRRTGGAVRKGQEPSRESPVQRPRRRG